MTTQENTNQDADLLDRAHRHFLMLGRLIPEMKTWVDANVRYLGRIEGQGDRFIFRLDNPSLDGVWYAKTRQSQIRCVLNGKLKQYRALSQHCFAYLLSNPWEVTYDSNGAFESGRIVNLAHLRGRTFHLCKMLLPTDLTRPLGGKLPPPSYGFATCGGETRHLIMSR